MIITSWTYGPREAGQRREDASFAGISPANAERVAYDLRRDGHAILTDDRTSRPWHHNVAGCGVGHNDAEFAEAGRSMAAYYENDSTWPSLREPRDDYERLMNLIQRGRKEAAA